MPTEIIDLGLSIVAVLSMLSIGVVLGRTP